MPGKPVLQREPPEVLAKWKELLGDGDIRRPQELHRRLADKAMNQAMVLTHPDHPGVGVLIILKNASRTMVHYNGVNSVLAPANPTPDEIHVFVRDPIARLRSAYQFFQESPPVPGAEGGVKITWEQFIDAVLDGAMNPHWRPVSRSIEIVGKPVIVHRLETLSANWPFTGGKLDKRNKSIPRPVNLRYREDEIKALYAEDYALRNPSP